MTDYIRREDALKALYNDYAYAAMDIIKRLPAADVAEVVHCKGCKHRTENGNCGHTRHRGILPSAYPYDFCSYGERREE
mgnify:CR=1 FL=1